MWNRPTEKQLMKMPRLYETEGIPLQEKVIYQHYFLGGSDWYMAEYDPGERIFFGYAILNNDLQNSEWGYTSLDELESIRIHGYEVDRDLLWRPKRFSEIQINYNKHQNGQ